MAFARTKMGLFTTTNNAKETGNNETNTGVLLPEKPQTPKAMRKYFSALSVDKTGYSEISPAKSVNEKPQTPKAKKKNFSSVSVDASLTPKSKKKHFSSLSVEAARSAKHAGSPPLSPVPKRMFLRKNTRSESSLLDWVLKSNCCRTTGQRASEADVQSPFLVDCYTLTPLYVDPERESFEIRRSVPSAASPLPWASFPEPDYPKWIRNELRYRSCKLPRGLSKAKSEDRSRSYTIPNLPSQQAIPHGATLKEESSDLVVLKPCSSQPAALDISGISASSTANSTPAPERHPHSLYRAGRHNTTDVSFPEELLDSPVSVGGGSDSRIPSFSVLHTRRPALTPNQIFGESRASSSLSSHGELSEKSFPVSVPLPQHRRRSSVVVIPPMQICPGDLLVYGQSNQNMVELTKQRKSQGSFDRHLASPDLTGSTISLPLSDANSAEGRKKSWSIMKLFDRSSRSKSDAVNLEDQLLTLKVSEFHDDSLMRYKILHWSDLTPISNELSEAEIKRREAIWEMFQSELVLLLDHLLVLKHVFLEPLKQLQVEGFVMHVAPEKLFGNLDELCAANYELCIDFAEMMEQSAKENDQFVSLDRLVELLRKNSLQDFEADHDTALTFQRYCLHYINALNYLESVRKHDDFNEYEKFCSQDQRCHRLQLTDLLVTPVQHTMKRPLLLREICKHSERCGYDCSQLKILLEETESALRGLDEKINWLRNFEKLQTIQKQLVWPSVIDLQDPKIFIPDVLKQHLAKQPCEGLILSPRRIIVQEGSLSLIESGKPVEMQVFLFDDMLLLTKKRKGLLKKKSSVSETYSLGTVWNPESTSRYVVYKQPMPLDRIIVHDMSPSEQANPSLKNSIVILHVSRYQQIIAAVTLQAASESSKVLWLTKIRLTMDKWRSAHLDHNGRTPGDTINHFSTISEF